MHWYLHETAAKAFELLSKQKHILWYYFAEDRRRPRIMCSVRGGLTAVETISNVAHVRC